MSIINSRENELSSSYIKKNYEQLEKLVNKLQIEITKKDKEIQTLQSELQIFKKSTNNTSSQFPMSSEFKKQWLNLIQTTIMDSFDNIYSNNILLSFIVQKSFRTIYEQTKELIHAKIVFLLNCLGIVDQNEEMIQIFFIKFRKILLQDYYKTIFCCSGGFIKNTLELIKKDFFLTQRTDYHFTIKDKEDVMKDLNSNEMKKFIEESFNLCLFMRLHDPPLTLHINDKLEYFYYLKTEYINIEGFAKDNSPCLMILYPPMIRANTVFKGIKAAVYACETVTDSIINQCDENKKYQRLKKKTSKALSDGEGKYSNNTSNDGKSQEFITSINYNTIEELSRGTYKKNNSANLKVTYKENCKENNKDTPINLELVTTNATESTKRKTLLDNSISSNGTRDKRTGIQEHISMFDVNDPNGFKLTANIVSNQYNKIHNNNNQRSKSVNKPVPNVMTKNVQKPLLSNYKNKKEETPIVNPTNNNMLTFNRTKLKENIINNANKLISGSNYKERITTVLTGKPKENSESMLHARQPDNKSNSPNHIIDKSRNNSRVDHGATNSNKYEITKTADNLLTTENRNISNSPTLNYLRTPIPTRQQSNTDNRDLSSRRDTQNQNSTENILISGHMNGKITIHNKKSNENSNINNSINNINSCGNSVQSAIKKVSSGNNYLRKIISDTNGNYQLNHKQAKKIVNEKNNNSFRRSEIKRQERKDNDIDNDDNNSNSNTVFLRTNSQPEELNTYYGNTINRNNSSSNSLLTNNSNSQSNMNQYSSKKMNRNYLINNKNHYYTANSNNESKGSILHNNKLEYNSINSKQTTSKNYPTIIFNASKGVSYGSNQILKTDCNVQSTNNSSIQTMNTFKGPNSNRLTNNNNNRGMMITNDFKFNGLKKNDHPVQKKVSMGTNAVKRKLDVMLNYDISSLQFQTMEMNNPSLRVDKDKSTGGGYQYTTNKSISNNTAITSTLGNSTCNDNPNLTTKYTSKITDTAGGNENYYFNNIKQRKYGSQTNSQSNQMGVKNDTYFGLKK